MANTYTVVIITKHCSKGAIIIPILHLRKLRHTQINCNWRRFETRQFVSCAGITMNLLGPLRASVTSNFGKTLWSLVDILRAGNFGEEKGSGSMGGGIKLN